MEDTRRAQEAARNLAPYILPSMDSEAQEDYASCIVANEPYVALILLMGFVKESPAIPNETLVAAFEALTIDDKERFHLLMDSRFAKV